MDDAGLSGDAIVLGNVKGHRVAEGSVWVAEHCPGGRLPSPPFSLLLAPPPPPLMLCGQTPPALTQGRGAPAFQMPKTITCLPAAVLRP